MHFLGRPKSPRRLANLAFIATHYIGVTFAPWRVIHLGDDVLDRLTVRSETVIETDRIEAITEVRKVGQQADRANGPFSRFGFDQVADAV